MIDVKHGITTSCCHCSIETCIDTNSSTNFGDSLPITALEYSASMRRHLNTHVSITSPTTPVMGRKQEAKSEVDDGLCYECPNRRRELCSKLNSLHAALVRARNLMMVGKAYQKLE